MNAAKRNGFVSSLGAAVVGLLGGSGRGVFLGVALVGVLLIGALVAWNKWGDEILSDPRYTLLAEDIQVTPQPDWIQGDVKAEVLRDSGLGQILVSREEGLASHVADAFSLHSWVAKVNRVHLYPQSIAVDLQYRRPIAMVEINIEGQPGLLPIDTEGYLLPPDDFSTNQAREYLRVSIGDGRPAGPVGTPWGDERVVQAAMIANALDNQWQSLGLYRIVAPDERVGIGRQRLANFQLVTRNGARVIWGNAPGREPAGEATASQKIAWLVQHAKRHGPLDASGGPAVIDVRDSQNVSITPRTAELRSDFREEEAH